MPSLGQEDDSEHLHTLGSVWYHTIPSGNQEEDPGITCVTPN